MRRKPQVNSGEPMAHTWQWTVRCHWQLYKVRHHCLGSFLLVQMFTTTAWVTLPKDLLTLGGDLLRVEWSSGSVSCGLCYNMLGSYFWGTMSSSLPLHVTEERKHTWCSFRVVPSGPCWVTWGPYRNSLNWERGSVKQEGSNLEPYPTTPLQKTWVFVYLPGSPFLKAVCFSCPPSSLQCWNECGGERIPIRPWCKNAF